METYYFKATKDGMVSGYDPDFVHTMGLNKHPNPDRESKDPCGRGVHLAKTFYDALRYVKAAAEVYLVTSTDIIAGDAEKIRVGEYNVLWRIPQQIIKAYQSKLDALYKEYMYKMGTLYKEYQSKRDVLDGEAVQEILRLYAKEKAKEVKNGKSRAKVEKARHLLAMCQPRPAGEVHLSSLQARNDILP